jgi:hypothetical protein
MVGRTAQEPDEAKSPRYSRIVARAASPQLMNEERI